MFVKPQGQGSALPLPTVNVVRDGDRIAYAPVGNAFADHKKAQVAVILVPADASAPARILPAKSARAAAEWPVPGRVGAIGFVVGPDGVDAKKLAALLEHDPGVVDRLADYAEQHTKVEALIQALSTYEQSAPDSGSLQFALKGFSSQYGVDLPALDRTRPTNEQATALLRAITPAFAPASSQGNLAQQSGGLAASVASLFFGAPVGLAVGGAALAGNLHASLFPPTDFQAAFTQQAGANSLVLCTGDEKRTAKARIEFVWMMRLSDADAPSVSIVDRPRLPLGWHSTIRVHCATVAQLKTLPRARQWRLVSPMAEAVVPVHIDTADAADTLTVDLAKVTLPAGEYRLEATWDWTRVVAAGRVRLRPIDDLSSASISSASQDRLIAGTGTAAVDFTRADFEFVDHLTIARTGNVKSAVPLAFTTRDDNSGEAPLTAQALVDTDLLRPGSYVLTLTELNGVAQTIPATVHPPNPTLTGLPLRANLGDAQQTLRLTGTALERIEHITGPDAVWHVSPTVPGAHDLTERDVEIALGPNARRGEHLTASLFVTGLHAPIDIPDAAAVFGPRPTITGVETAFAGETGVQLRHGEIPAGVPVGFAIRADSLGTHPRVQLTCRGEGTASTTLGVGDRPGTETLARTGQNTLFLSFDPGHIVASGCVLDATIINPAAGASDPYSLGRSVRLPRIERFTLTSEKGEGALFAGLLTGESLELVERTGWTADAGWPVQGIATPVPGSPGKQTLRIALPWPSPSPQAPLYIWLRDENEARRTDARY